MFTFFAKKTEER